MQPVDALHHLTAEERAELDELILGDPVIWRPLPGPQMAAAQSGADIVGYGGAAGGGKTDLACGLALTEHRRAIVFRVTGTELLAIRNRLAEIDRRGQYNGKDSVWNTTRPADGAAVSIELGAFPDLGDERKFQGRPHDLLVFDEASNMRQSQVRFLLGWLRSTHPGQRCRALLTFNPPTTAEGRWVVAFFAPWLDAKHPNPARPGEIRWFASVGTVDHEVADSRPFVMVEGRRNYTFSPDDYAVDDIIKPMSRTFIPSRIADNPFLFNTGYMRVLQALPEPLRSQMLKGDFAAGMKDNAFQVVPTAWVEMAMAKWKKPDKLAPMDSLGADIAMGGDDEHVIMCRHGMWFSEPIAHPGHEILDGAASGAHVIAAMRDRAPLHIDLLGPGALTYGFLMQAQQQVLGVSMGEKTPALDATGTLKFFNLRSQLWWRMREALDPFANTGICLPSHPRLLADLCAPVFEMVGSKIKVEGRDDIVKKLGRSPDYATAAILALIDTPKRGHVLDVFGRRKTAREPGRGHDPFAILDA